MGHPEVRTMKLSTVPGKSPQKPVLWRQLSRAGLCAVSAYPLAFGSFGGPLTPTFSLVALGVSALGWGKLLT